MARPDYTSQPGTENQDIEQAMSIFVKWAKENDRNYFGNLVKENLEKLLEDGHTPQTAVDTFLRKET